MEKNDEQEETELPNVGMDDDDALKDALRNVGSIYETFHQKEDGNDLLKFLKEVSVSTVASESAFSTEGRVLDPFRSSLNPKVVEYLVCAQDWLRKSAHFSIEEILQDVEKMKKEGRAGVVEFIHRSPDSPHGANLKGPVYPIKSNEDVMNMFKIHYGKNIISIYAEDKALPMRICDAFGHDIRMLNEGLLLEWCRGMEESSTPRNYVFENDKGYEDDGGDDVHEGENVHEERVTDDVFRKGKGIATLDSEEESKGDDEDNDEDDDSQGNFEYMGVDEPMWTDYTKGMDSRGWYEAQSHAEEGANASDDDDDDDADDNDSDGDNDDDDDRDRDDDDNEDNDNDDDEDDDDDDDDA
ncbi:uncharacterized protein LOC127244116 [Andrographis paniculata]|uniref:uncharacterized protein LOC127244116 n=1 Tax=Andrographis paniculata TaxID=175694 RepID=UPI0021E84143|nr:uncharacterized protein LOC127244116 [Andrographis paniculata]